jgi:large conductance mechanosensitive channel
MPGVEIKKNIGKVVNPDIPRELLRLIAASLPLALIVALAVFLLIRLLNRLYQAPPATPTTKACAYCIAVIPLAASRCPQCTSDLRAA